MLGRDEVIWTSMLYFQVCFTYSGDTTYLSEAHCGQQPAPLAGGLI